MLTKPCFLLEAAEIPADLKKSVHGKKSCIVHVYVLTIKNRRCRLDVDSLSLEIAVLDTFVSGDLDIK